MVRKLKMGYKVVDIETHYPKRKYQSITRRLSYFIGKKTRRQIFDGALAVFDKLKDAVRFARVNGWYIILKVVYKQSKNDSYFTTSKQHYGGVRKNICLNSVIGKNFADWVIPIGEIVR
jgi:hypothetical protein